MGRPKGQQPHVPRWYQHPEFLDEVAEYRLQDYDNALQEIHTLAERVNNGDVSLVIGEGFSIPRDLDCVDLWVTGDNYHSQFPRISTVGKNG